MARLESSLLVKVILTLAATALLPLAISFSQLRLNKDALFEQVQRTHMVAAKTAAARADAVLASLETVAASLATHPAIASSPRSREATELLAGVLQARPDIAAAGVFDPTGGRIVLARRADVENRLPEGIGAGAEAIVVLQGRDRHFLRVAAPLAGEVGRVVLLADAEPLAATVAAELEMGSEARMVLATRAGEVLFGGMDDLGGFPAEVVERAKSGKVIESLKARAPEGGGDLIVAHFPLREAPWTVLSRQPARAAELAERRILQTTWIALSLALLLTTGLSRAAFVTVVRPLRRLVRAQRSLLGDESVASSGGSEIAQLEKAFAELEMRMHDRENLHTVSLGRYQVVDVLGQGAMGTVFRAWDPKLERSLALKTIRIESEDEKREKLISTLLREAVTSARFSHPNIVTVYDVAEEGRAAFIGMELVEGVSLEELLAARRRLSWREVVVLGAAVGRALEAAHAQGLVHQDIKPANLLLGRDDSIKVTDFGISQLISAASASSDVICGTPGFIAPESLDGGGYSSKSDLFALGVMLYECLAGEHPFSGRTVRAVILNTLSHDPPPLARLDLDLPPELERLIFQLLEKDPHRRPGDAAEVAESFERLAARLDLRWHLSFDTHHEPATPEPLARTQPIRLHTQLVSLEESRSLIEKKRREDGDGKA